MSIKVENPNFYRTTLNLPKFRVDDWYKWLDAFFNTVRADEVGQQIDLVNPEFIVALAKFREQGMPPERMVGFVLGISALQYLHFTGHILVKMPPEFQDLTEEEMRG